MQYFVVTQVESDNTTIKRLVDTCRLDANKDNIFLELDQSQSIEHHRDILLMDKVTITFWEITNIGLFL